ncbi:MAG: hypothetical protein QOE68_4304 [Thermoanaerobaculia bacterium]|jgi:hypothetical protein|nr:hypothetical protein [Thermoanaerobaculia bacterium]
MHALAILLFAATTSFPPPILTTTLILRNGTRFDVEGPIREERGRIIFRSGTLYSIPVAEVDMDATRAAVTKTVLATVDQDRKLKVSAAERDRLLRELEQNHSGGPVQALNLEKVVEPREAPDKGDEWSWRSAARAHEEAIRRAKENLALLRDRAELLKRQIEQFVALGYRSHQFTYQSSELQLTLDQIPAAELEITRAERANAQFRDDARKQGIMPGWLR